MRIRVLGGGWYGCHLTAALIAQGHDVELHEIAGRLFAGASGANPARCHLGFHYPRAADTRQACINHHHEFMRVYGHLTSSVPINIYAVAAEESLVDFGTYLKVMEHQAQFITIARPAEHGLQNVEGAVLTGERHVIIEKARAHFDQKLAGVLRFNQPKSEGDGYWHLTIDCTFCALDAESIDRYEPCVTGILQGPIDRAVTIMDGPFPSIYPWNEERGLSSLTSAKFTPLSKTCSTYDEAKAVLEAASDEQLQDRCVDMLRQVARFWPVAWDRYSITDYRTSIRAMPRSSADNRLASVVRTGEREIRVRAGKIDAIFHAEREVNRIIAEMAEWPRRRPITAAE